jgi:hypothetical protein
VGIFRVTTALKAPQHDSPGQRPGTRNPKEIQALKERHNIALKGNVIKRHTVYLVAPFQGLINGGEPKPR